MASPNNVDEEEDSSVDSYASDTSAHTPLQDEPGYCDLDATEEDNHESLIENGTFITPDQSFNQTINNTANKTTFYSFTEGDISLRPNVTNLTDEAEEQLDYVDDLVDECHSITRPRNGGDEDDDVPLTENAVTRQITKDSKVTHSSHKGTKEFDDSSDDEGELSADEDAEDGEIMSTEDEACGSDEGEVRSSSDTDGEAFDESDNESVKGPKKRGGEKAAPTGDQTESDAAEEEEINEEELLLPLPGGDKENETPWARGLRLAKERMQQAKKLREIEKLQGLEEKKMNMNLADCEELDPLAALESPVKPHPKLPILPVVPRADDMLAEYYLAAAEDQQRPRFLPSNLNKIDFTDLEGLTSKATPAPPVPSIPLRPSKPTRRRSKSSSASSTFSSPGRRKGPPIPRPHPHDHPQVFHPEPDPSWHPRPTLPDKPLDKPEVPPNVPPPVVKASGIPSAREGWIDPWDRAKGRPQRPRRAGSGVDARGRRSGSNSSQYSTRSSSRSSSGSSFSSNSRSSSSSSSSSSGSSSSSSKASSASGSPGRRAKRKPGPRGDSRGRSESDSDARSRSRTRGRRDPQGLPLRRDLSPLAARDHSRAIMNPLPTNPEAPLVKDSAKRDGTLPDVGSRQGVKIHLPPRQKLIQPPTQKRSLPTKRSAPPLSVPSNKRSRILESENQPFPEPSRNEQIRQDSPDDHEEVRENSAMASNDKRYIVHKPSTSKKEQSGRSDSNRHPSSRHDNAQSSTNRFGYLDGPVTYPSNRQHHSRPGGDVNNRGNRDSSRQDPNHRERDRRQAERHPPPGSTGHRDSHKDRRQTGKPSASGGGDSRSAGPASVATEDSKKSAAVRRKLELMRQLKEVEDAIAKKKAKIDGK